MRVAQERFLDSLTDDEQSKELPRGSVNYGERLRRAITRCRYVSSHTHEAGSPLPLPDSSVRGGEADQFPQICVNS